jgi:hypothetical protein
MGTLVHGDMTSRDMTSLGRSYSIRRPLKPRASVSAAADSQSPGWGTAGPILLFLAGLMLMRLGAAEVMATAPITPQTIEAGTLAGD